MGKTITEKILIRASGKKEVVPGEFITVKPDKVQFNDASWQLVLRDFFDRVELEKLWDPNAVIVQIDHRVPSDTVEQADSQKSLREWVWKYGITHWYDIGRGGICSTPPVEDGLILPGSLYFHSADLQPAAAWGALGALCFGGQSLAVAEVIATGECVVQVPVSDRFTITGNFDKGVMERDLCFYMASILGVKEKKTEVAEFQGQTIDSMSIGSRMSLCSNSTFGTQTAIISPDRKTTDYVKERTKEPFEVMKSDLDAIYKEVFEYDVSILEPWGAVPPLNEPRAISELEGIEIDQAFIGSCCAGRLEDLRVAAKILKGRKVHPKSRLLITPISQNTYLDAAKEGLIEIFIRAHALVDPPSCGSCLGAHRGILGDDEVCISTGTRTYPGRMGSPRAVIYLGSTATVAASAVKGKITDPRKFLK